MAYRNRWFTVLKNGGYISMSTTLTCEREKLQRALAQNGGQNGARKLRQLVRIIQLLIKFHVS
jgi:hypothetical protein